MSYLEELLPEFRKGAKIRRKCWVCGIEGVCKDENYSFNAYDVDADDWEVVPDKPIDWDSIIKNKCLCFFWDDNFKEACVGILGGVYEGLRLKYALRDEKGDQVQCRNCRPVRRNEVTFYEDKKDE